ncbi:hypothetical protein FEM48_Zijuj05G0093600 [Ziziphus jujuba var. spinosa]|uniref:GST C-terminal domain-containing protein n=1 Tax=Ziziphus jujuba var. spinosa TaxID=714518 RepID=A0A978VE51_ZIZJJ|nr:hypothetical protein FEM48_Zijuj05G0093600 [Ziziphus jujuba var. spinosa]
MILEGVRLLVCQFYCVQVVFGVSAAWKAEGEEKEKTIVSVKESIVFLEKQLEGRKFFGGEKIGYLDLVLGWILHWTGVMEEVGDMKLLEKDNFTLIHEWSQNFTHIPIIKECLPTQRKSPQPCPYFQSAIALQVHPETESVPSLTAISLQMNGR